MKADNNCRPFSLCDVTDMYFFPTNKSIKINGFHLTSAFLSGSVMKTQKMIAVLC